MVSGDLARPPPPILAPRNVPPDHWATVCYFHPGPRSPDDCSSTARYPANRNPTCSHPAVETSFCEPIQYFSRSSRGKKKKKEREKKLHENCPPPDLLPFEIWEKREKRYSRREKKGRRGERGRERDDLIICYQVLVNGARTR